MSVNELQIHLLLEFWGSEQGKLKKQTAKIAGQLAKKIAASVLTTGLPWLLAGLGALGGVALISYFAGLVVDNEFSRTQDANYALFCLTIF